MASKTINTRSLAQEKQALSDLLAEQWEHKLQEELDFDTFLHELFLLSVGVMYKCIHPSTATLRVFERITAKVSLHDVLYANPQYLVKILHVLVALHQLGIVSQDSLKNLSSEGLLRREFGGEDLYYLSHLLNIQPLADLWCHHNDLLHQYASMHAQIDQALEKALTNIPTIQDESFLLIEAYLLLHIKGLSKNTKKRAIKEVCITWCSMQYCLSQDANYLAYLVCLAPQLAKKTSMVELLQDQKDTPSLLGIALLQEVNHDLW